jgi:uncharacterized protein (DUF433 family)
MNTSFSDRIEINPNVCGGKPVFKNTRITVAGILEFLYAGDTAEELLYQFPDLTKADIDAAWAYAIQLVNREHTIVYYKEAS